MLQLNYKKTKNIAPFSALGYTASAKVNCAISPKPERVAEELAKGTVRSLLNGCEKDGNNGGGLLQSAAGQRRKGAFRWRSSFYNYATKTTKKILKGGN